MMLVIRTYNVNERLVKVLVYDNRTLVVTKHFVEVLNVPSGRTGHLANKNTSGLTRLLKQHGDDSMARKYSTSVLIHKLSSLLEIFDDVLSVQKLKELVESNTHQKEETVHLDDSDDDADAKYGDEKEAEKEEDGGKEEEEVVVVETALPHKKREREEPAASVEIPPTTGGVTDELRRRCRDALLLGMRNCYIQSHSVVQLSDLVTRFEQQKLYEPFKDQVQAYLTNANLKLLQLDKSNPPLTLAPPERSTVPILLGAALKRIVTDAMKEANEQRWRDEWHKEAMEKELAAAQAQRDQELAQAKAMVVSQNQAHLEKVIAEQRATLDAQLEARLAENRAKALAELDLQKRLHEETISRLKKDHTDHLDKIRAGWEARVNREKASLLSKVSSALSTALSSSPATLSAPSAPFEGVVLKMKPRPVAPHQ